MSISRLLGQVSLVSKLFMLIGLLVATLAVTSFLSLGNVSDLTEAAERIERTGDEIKLGSAMEADVLDMSRAEYVAATGAASIDSVETGAYAAADRLVSKLDQARQMADERQRGLLDDVQMALEAYQTKLASTFEMARFAANGELLGDARTEVTRTVNDHDAQVQPLRAAIDAYVNFTDRKAMNIADEAAATGEDAFASTMLTAAIGILIALVGGFLVALFGISRPARAVMSALDRIIAGDFDFDIPGTWRKDEIGGMARATEQFRDTIVKQREADERERAREEREAAREAEAEQRRLEEEAAAAERQAEKEREEMERRRNETLELAEKFEARVGRVVREVKEAAMALQSSSQQMGAAVEQTSSQSSTIAASAEQSNGSVQSVASAAEQLSVAIREVSRSISSTADRTRETASGARSAGRDLDELVTLINQVDAIVESINDVAEQTNLLALNATIEAARAGDAGKGFAVVASEVKSLASQTRNMTDSINEQLEQIKSSAGRSADRMQGILKEIDSIDSAASTMASSVEEQNAATGEISRSVSEAATGVSLVAENITGIQAAATQSAQATTEVQSASTQLATEAERLEKALDDFLDEMRAA